MKTTKFLSTAEAKKAQGWKIIDVAGKTLGRASSQIATILRGKDKPSYTPNQDCGDFVIVINAGQIKMTGKKLSDKIYYSHSQYIGGLKQISAGDLLQKNPERLLTLAVKAMLPKSALGKNQARKLKIYRGSEHPHTAQKPQVFNVK